MSKKPNQPDPLRAEAEAQLAGVPPAETPVRPAGKLLHELQVHQIELEMQNENLRQAQIALEESRDRYADLYEFAPAGYLTLTRNGMISEMNLTGSMLLGMERNKLLQHRFASLVAPEYRDYWNRHFLSTLKHDNKLACELALRHGDGHTFHVQLDCVRLVKEGAAPVVHITLTDITERKQMERQLRDLTAHLQAAREEEKTSIAREIHDDMGGTLTALKMEAYWLADELLANKETASLLEHTRLISQLADDATNVMRRIITGLRPSILDDLGLPAALEWQAAQFHQRTGIECRVNCVADEGCEKMLDKTQSINLFRIFQESLTNVSRHSFASKVEIEFHLGDNEAVLSISDNGRGMPKGGVVASTSHGLLGMAERAEQLGGRINIGSSPSGGLSVTVMLPSRRQQKREEA